MVYRISHLLLAFYLLLGVSNLKAQHHPPASRNVTMPGNQIFGTIQEVISALKAEPNINWKQVDIEALRQHLLDMKAFTEEVEVVEKKAIKSGVEVTVRPTTERAATALKNLFAIHPMMLKKEKGWNMKVEHYDTVWKVRCTSENTMETEKIRALGYIGFMAEGIHHQRHHLMIATGKMKKSSDHHR